jgi:hypothetical protein
MNGLLFQRVLADGNADGKIGFALMQLNEIIP